MHSSVNLNIHQRQHQHQQARAPDDYPSQAMAHRTGRRCMTSRRDNNASVFESLKAHCGQLHTCDRAEDEPHSVLLFVFAAVGEGDIVKRRRYKVKEESLVRSVYSIRSASAKSPRTVKREWHARWTVDQLAGSGCSCYWYVGSISITRSKPVLKASLLGVCGVRPLDFLMLAIR